MAAIISASSLNGIKAAHRKLLAGTTTAVAEASIEAGEFAVDFVRMHPGFKPRTGALQQATQWQTVRAPGGRIVRIRNPKAYAAAIDLGSRPHDIVARRGNALAFTVGGKLMFRRRVRHPGTRPYRFLYRATNAAGRVLAQVLAVKMRKLSQNF